MPLYLAHFLTLDRQDGSSRAGAEVSHTFDTSRADLRTDAHGQYYDEDLGVGGYVSVAGRLGSTETGARNFIGNTEAGLMTAASDENNQTVALHIGALIPTTYAFTTNAKATSAPFDARLTDASQSYGARAYGVRAGLSFMRRDGRTFSQLDLGGELVNTTNSVHVNGGLGIDFGDVALVFESTNGNATSHWTDEGAIGVRAAVGPVQPYAAAIGGIVENGGSKVYLAAVLGLDVPVR
ncbi:MAG TPA: hypothetical protein VLT45_18475 [Kofleriaceae bacterium]|nr:hypothetical protein [Kofleriaceae bacterium]